MTHAGLTDSAGAPAEVTLKDIAARLKQVHGLRYHGTTVVYRAWAAHLLEHPSSQLDQLIEEDPPASILLKLTPVEAPDIANERRSIQVAKCSLATMRKEHENLWPKTFTI